MSNMISTKEQIKGFIFILECMKQYPEHWKLDYALSQWLFPMFYIEDHLYPPVGNLIFLTTKYIPINEQKKITLDLPDNRKMSLFEWRKLWSVKSEKTRNMVDKKLPFKQVKEMIKSIYGENI